MSEELNSPTSEKEAIVLAQPQTTEMLPATTNAEPLDVSTIQRIAEGIDTAEVIEINLASSYWTPVAILEKKRLVFLEIKQVLTDDIKDPTQKILLTTAIFVESVNGTLKRISNASKKLIGVLEDNRLAPGSRLEITFLGKVKNKNNNYSSDTWAVKLLNINIS